MVKTDAAARAGKHMLVCMLSLPCTETADVESHDNSSCLSIVPQHDSLLGVCKQILDNSEPGC